MNPHLCDTLSMRQKEELKLQGAWAGETAQWLKGLAALSEDLGLISSTHMVSLEWSHSSPRECDTLYWPLCAVHAHGTQTIHVSKPTIHIAVIKSFLFFFLFY